MSLRFCCFRVHQRGRNNLEPTLLLINNDRAQKWMDSAEKFFLKKVLKLFE